MRVQKRHDSDKERTLFSPRQAQVLLLKFSGKSQSDIARILGTSRANVCVLERRAFEKAEQAKNTLRVFSQFKRKSYARVVIKAGTDVRAASRKVFNTADRHGIKINLTSLGVFNFIEKSRNAKDGKLVKTTEVLITGDGFLQEADERAH